MRDYPNYLSEFEQEFELDNEAGNAEQSYEAHDDSDNEWEEHEDSYEMETDNEQDAESYEEHESDDHEWEGMGEERSYEQRLYEVLSSGSDNEMEMEHEVDRILHEMEQDYFWGSVGNFLKKKGAGLIKKYAGKLPFGGALKAISSVARGDIRGGLKNLMNDGMFKQAISFLPGGSLVSKGMDVANGMMNNETALPISKQKVNQIVAVGKQAYQNLASSISQATNVNDVKDLGKKAVQQAVQMTKTQQSPMRGKHRVRVPIKPGSIVTVHPTYVIIWQS